MMNLKKNISYILVSAVKSCVVVMFYFMFVATHGMTFPKSVVVLTLNNIGY
jgi:hypothetical protein